MKQLRLLPKGPPDHEVPTEPTSRVRVKSPGFRTINMRRMTQRERRAERAQLELLEREDPLGEVERPRRRADCEKGPRPCPFVSCAHHLMLDVNARNGSIKMNFDDIESMPETCSLDVAAKRGTSIEEVARALGLTREGARQIEVKAMAKLISVADMYELRDAYGPTTPPRRRRRRLPVLNASDDDAEADESAFDVEAFAGDGLDDDR